MKTAAGAASSFISLCKQCANNMNAVFVHAAQYISLQSAVN